MSAMQIAGFDLLQAMLSSRGNPRRLPLNPSTIFLTTLYADSTDLCQKYKLFPDLSDWEGKILLLETSEEKPEPG